MVVAGETFGVRETKGQPDLRVIVHEIRSSFHDADDLNATPVEFDVLAEHGRAPKADCQRSYEITTTG